MSDFGRGMRAFAVMAMRPGWKRPRFVWDGFGQFEIFQLKHKAEKHKEQLTSASRAFYSNESHEGERVDFIVKPVWIETMEVAD